jgi:hypothetical protein
MALTITLRPEVEQRFRDEAAREGMTVDDLATQRLIESELLWRIRTATPKTETREFHRLLRRRNAGRLTEADQTRLQSLLDDREERAARRLEDLAQLASLRVLPVRQLMEQLGIGPLSTP